MFMISPNDTSSRDSLSDAQRRAAMVRRVIEDCMVRRSSGNRLTDEEITSSHADLMPELGEELALLSVMERARWAASSTTHDATLDAGSRRTASTDIAALLSFRGYDLDREIHRGGQGVVYKAVQRSTQRPIAIKVLHESQIADRRDAARFEREARILGLLNHPNVVKIHDTGIIAGRRYLAMDLIDGKPWDRHEGATGEACRDIRGAAADRFAAICDAVNAAHLRGIIHRDLKPGNVLIDEAGMPHVLDFGLAKLTEASSADTASMTAEGQFIGSLPWASPEQAAGQSELLDVRSDVYSLGVMFYQVLTGAFPYNIKGPWRTVADTILQTEPCKPRTHRPELDIDLERIVLKCLAKDPAQRYQSAGELAADVRRYLAGEPVMARGGSTFYVLARLARKHRMAVAGAAAFLILLGASAVVTTLLYQRERTALTDATAARNKAEAETSKARAVLGFLQDMMSAADPNRDGKDVKVVELLEQSTKSIDDQFKEQPEIEATVRDTVGQTYYGLGVYDQAEVQFRAALELREALLGSNATDTLDTRMNLAATLWVEGKLPEAEPLARQTYEAHVDASGAESEEAVSSGRLLSCVLNARGKFSESLPIVQHGYEFCLRQHGPEHLETLTAQNSVAFTLDGMGKDDEAEQSYRNLVEVSSRVLGAESSMTLTAKMNLANVLRALGRPGEAEPYVRELLVNFKKNLPPTHARIGDCLSELGGIVFAKGDYAGAEKLYLEALSIYQAALGDDSWRTAGTRAYLVGVYAMLKRFDDGETQALAALNALRPSWGEHRQVEMGLKKCVERLCSECGNTAKAAQWNSTFEELDNSDSTHEPSAESETETPESGS
ncbi:MAG: serine/threonine protein kinase [Planctomycetes bacterium]|nr:serine/threonine protein kinase [Planctomycetota bacterium]